MKHLHFLKFSLNTHSLKKRNSNVSKKIEFTPLGGQSGRQVITENNFLKNHIPYLTLTVPSQF
jgi:hypothetical protein